ncbi:MAG TPA: shikimate kinase [Desulfuromonadales bacterium]|nr:shikimate kinase [Desulfuromonadales bacterium]
MSNLSEGKAIVLIGFMGSGKTTVGRELARRLQIPFVDLDSVIIEQAGMTIPEIFAREGEEGFRHRETQALESLYAVEGSVVATGGGVVTVEENWPLMRDLGPVVYLHARLHTALQRIGEGEGRPLANGMGRETRLGTLLELRKPLYERADLIVDTDGLTPSAVARTIIDKLQPGSHRC